jgi:hypothetical protein
MKSSQAKSLGAFETNGDVGNHGKINPTRLYQL